MEEEKVLKENSEGENLESAQDLLDIDDKPRIQIIFEGDALNKLLELGSSLGLPEEQVTKVIIKGMKLIDLAKEGKLYIEKADGKRFEVDIKNL